MAWLLSHQDTIFYSSAIYSFFYLFCIVEPIQNQHHLDNDEQEEVTHQSQNTPSKDHHRNSTLSALPSKRLAEVSHLRLELRIIEVWIHVVATI